MLKKVLVSAGRNESWLYRAGADEVLVCAPSTPRCPKIAKNAQDGQAFVTFAVANYDRLASLRVAFVHGGAREWHHASDIRQQVLHGWTAPERFMHFGSPAHRKCTRILHTGWCEHILKPQNISCGDDEDICTYQGFEFMAFGSEMRSALTLAQWKGMEQTCNGLDVPPREFGRGYKGCSFAMEFVGQLFSGGPRALPVAPRVEL